MGGNNRLWGMGGTNFSFGGGEGLLLPNRSSNSEFTLV